MSGHLWVQEFAGAVTVCDPDGIILEMNEKAARSFQDQGGKALIGTNMLDCHPEPARTKTRELLDSRRTNVYTIEKRGQKKLVYQAPWYQDGEYRGFVEWVLEIPAEMPHFVRESNGRHSSSSSLPHAASLRTEDMGPSMPISCRFTHVNLVARDWRRLAEFYATVFGCVPVPPERDLAGQWLDQATGIPDAKIRGVHLRLPGHGAEGPTLEIFQYAHQEARPAPAVNRPGLGHIAFAVPDAAVAREAVLAAGGGAVGELVSADIPAAGRLRFMYATDPEGNVIELQQWER